MIQRVLNSSAARLIVDFSLFAILVYVTGSYLFAMFGACIPTWRQVSESLYAHGIVAKPITMVEFVADPVLSVIALMAKHLSVAMKIHAALLLLVGSLFRTKKRLLKYTLICLIILCIMSMQYVLLNRLSLFHVTIIPWRFRVWRVISDWLGEGYESSDCGLY